MAFTESTWPRIWPTAILNRSFSAFRGLCGASSRCHRRPAAGGKADAKRQACEYPLTARRELQYKFAIPPSTRIRHAPLVLPMSPSNLRLFTRFEPPAWQTIDLVRLLWDLVEQKQHSGGEKQICIEYENPEEISLYGDWKLLSQAIGNLIDNAVEASAPGSVVSIRTSCDMHALEIHVEDQGPGIELDSAQRVCRPFYTTKAGSLGLGLAVVRQVAEAHGGQVKIANNSGSGARMTLRLPRRHVTRAA